MAALLLLAGCATAPTGGVGASGPATTGRAPSAAAAVPPAAVVPSTGPIPPGARVTFVGDSIVRGYGVDPDEAWPQLVGDDLGWTSTNLGCDGGGFVQLGACGSAIGDRAEEVAATAPDVIVVETSSNDLARPTEDVVSSIAPAVTALLAASPSARLIGLGAVFGPSQRPDDLDAYDAALAEAVTAAGGTMLTFPDPLDDEGLLSADGVHPTADGQLALARAFTDAAEQAGLTETGPTAEPGTESGAEPSGVDAG